jgi:hypothetical protein
MIVLAMAAALTGGLTADALARGGGGGGHGGGGGQGGGFRRFLFGPDWDYGINDYACSYGYPYYNSYNCNLPAY